MTHLTIEKRRLVESILMMTNDEYNKERQCKHTRPQNQLRRPTKQNHLKKSLSWWCISFVDTYWSGTQTSNIPLHLFRGGNESLGLSPMLRSECNSVQVYDIWIVPHHWLVRTWQHGMTLVVDEYLTSITQCRSMIPRPFPSGRLVKVE